MQSIYRVLLISLLMVAIGCSGVRTRKVPHPPSYSLSAQCSGDKDAPCWNELRRKADELAGTRYYLPRPYIVAKQQFPVGGGTFFVRARVDGSLLKAVDALPEALTPFFPDNSLGDISRLKKGTSLDKTENLKAATPLRPFAPKKDEEQEDQGEEDQGEEDHDCEKKISGATATASGDPSTTPLFEVSDLYDILLLPDYSEQYALQVRSGLFRASASISLENGWMAELINTETDNSQLGEFLLSSADKLVDAATGEFFPQLKAVDEAEGQPDATESEVQQTFERLEQSGQPLIVRIDFVQLAVPGLHPVLKIEEQECGTKPDGPHACWPRVGWRTRDRLVMTLVGLKDPEESSGS